MLKITHATVFTGKENDDHYTSQDVFVDQGRIVAVGDLPDAPQSLDVLDASGLFLMPGLVDAHSHLGGFGSVGETEDLNEMTAAATPEMDAFYAMDPSSRDFSRALSAGITTSLITPGSGNVVGGTAIVLKSAGDRLEQRLLRRPAALKMALGGNPKSVYGPRNERPMTRMGVAQVIRDTLARGQEYLAKKEAAGDDPTKLPNFDRGLENVALALQHKIPLKVHCEQFDMMTVLRIAEEFDVLFTLDHAWGSTDFLEEILGVIFGPIGVSLLPGECGKVDIECLSCFDARGLCCALMTDGPIMAPEELVSEAGEAVRAGVPHHRVLRMLGANPAQIIGCADRVGTLEAGKDADLAFFRGIPALETSALCVRTMIEGKTVYTA